MIPIIDLYIQHVTFTISLNFNNKLNKYHTYINELFLGCNNMKLMLENEGGGGELDDPNINR